MTPPRDIPEGYEIGHWDFDPEVDPKWDNPEIPRRRAPVSEYPELADAVVRGELIEYCVIEDLRALIETLQAHPNVLLAKLETKDDNGIPRTAGVFDQSNSLVNKGATKLKLRGCLIEKTELGALDIGCNLVCQSHFAREVMFGGTKFGGTTSFTESIFSEGVVFEGAVFGGRVRFSRATFCKWVYFGNTMFGGEAWFWNVTFGHEASFSNATFGGKAKFDDATFRGKALFVDATFRSEASFEDTTIYDEAYYADTTFGGEVSFLGATFKEEAWFGDATFCCEASFIETEFDKDLVLTGVSIPVQGNLRFANCRFRRSVKMIYIETIGKKTDRTQSSPPPIQGKLFFTESTINERLRVDHAAFGPQARIGCNRFLARAGATIEIPRSLLEADRHSQLDQQRGVWAIVIARWQWLMRWFGFRRADALIMGEDSDDVAEMTLAAHDYELLAANFKKQPATDWEEDMCRWRAHEIRRRIDWKQKQQRYAEFLRNDEGFQASSDQSSFVGWGVEYLRVVLWSVAACLQWLIGSVWNVVWLWLIQRNAVGYLLRPSRIVATGAMLMIVFAVVYAVFGSHATIHVPEDAKKFAEMTVGDRVRFGGYFSLTTFVTLGYGDYSPKNWFKWVTGAEALLGVTLLALFTVAWGRKLVR